MADPDPNDEDRIFVGDYVLADLETGEQVSGEVTEITDDLATISDTDPDGSVADQRDVPVDQCRLHPQGRSMLSKLKVKVVDLDHGAEWVVVADFIGILGMGGLAILGIMAAMTAAAFILSPAMTPWVVVGGTIAVIGVLAWQAWTAYTVVKRKERRETNTSR